MGTPELMIRRPDERRGRTGVLCLDEGRAAGARLGLIARGEEALAATAREAERLGGELGPRGRRER